ncbi:MAG: YitT family protein [Treponema sp.]|nr:YitT family protein [Treponema sp.]
MHNGEENKKMANAESSATIDGKGASTQLTAFAPLRKSTIHLAKRTALVVVGAALMAFNINTFVYAGGLVPGGFTGLTLLILEVFEQFFHISLPFSVVLYLLNAAPAVVCFKLIGKRFTLLSVLMVFVCGLLTDWMPKLFIELIQLHDPLLSAVFGGILNAMSISLCLFADATSGGTDFIAVFISEKYGKDAWNYIFAGNCVILVFAASLFSLDKALYSVIFQFATTVALSSFYRGYQQKTLLIITSKPDEIYHLIRDKTRHDATAFKGVGMYRMAEKTLLYSVVAANEDASLTTAIKKVDPDAFINILKTEQIKGRFYKPPKD